MLAGAFVGCLAFACGSNGDDETPAATGGSAGSAGTGGAAGSGTGGTGASAPLPARVVVTADFLEQSISVFDYDALIGDASGEEALHQRIPLPDTSPGPLQVELTPDGTRAIVAAGPGFLAGLGLVFGFPRFESGVGNVVIVDLLTGEVTREVVPAHAPMGLTISDDGSRVYSANYGTADDTGTTLSWLDLGADTSINDIEVGARPEQVELSLDGSYGIVNLAGERSIRTFAVSDPMGTLSDPVETSADPSDVDFITADRALVVNSQGDAGYSILDVSTPSSPKVVETVVLDGGIPYAGTTIPDTSRALVGIATGSPARLVEIDVSTNPVSEVRRIELGNDETGSFPLGVAVAPDGSHAFVALPVDNTLAVVDLADGSVRRVSWLPEDATGATYAAVAFRE